jgi:type VII secretion protein EccB
MASRTDQLHSHQFARQRVIGALAMRDPDPASSPLRRIGGALFAGVMIAALALAAVGVYGVIRPGGSSSWRDGTSVIVERETGARFVYRDGVLHPVLNYSSALLVLGSAQPRTRLVARGSLAGVPRGVPLGIAGAPDLLPAAGDLIDAPWSLCSRSAPSGAERSGAESVLLVGATAGAVAPLGRAALLARDPDGRLHLIWNEHRFAIRDEAVVRSALGWSGQVPVPVAPALLNVVSPGPDLGRIPVAQRGRPAPLPGSRVGQVFVVESQGGPRQYAVALGDGLADITQVQADLLLADPATPQAAGPTPLAQAVYTAAARASPLIPTGDAAPPSTTPELTGPAPQGGVCASIPDGGGPGRIGLTPSMGRGSGEVPAVGRGDGSAPGADWVVVAPGRGSVVESLAGPGSPGGALGFVSDLGVCHPVPSAEVLTMLGYSGVRPQRLPAAVVALLPSGRALDPAAARQPAAP